MTIISQLEVVFGRQNCKQWFTFELAHQSPSFNCVNLAVKYCGENATWVGKILLEHSTKERGHMGPFLFMSLRSCCNAGAWWRLRSRNDRCRHNNLIGIANGKQSRVAKSRVLFSWLKFTVSGRKTPAARLIYSRRVGGGCHRPDRHKCLCIQTCSHGARTSTAAIYTRRVKPLRRWNAQRRYVAADRAAGGRQLFTFNDVWISMQLPCSVSASPNHRTRQLRAHRVSRNGPLPLPPITTASCFIGTRY